MYHSIRGRVISQEMPSISILNMGLNQDMYTWYDEYKITAASPRGQGVKYLFWDCVKSVQFLELSQAGTKTIGLVSLKFWGWFHTNEEIWFVVHKSSNKRYIYYNILSPSKCILNIKLYPYSWRFHQNCVFYGWAHSECFKCWKLISPTIFHHNSNFMEI